MINYHSLNIRKVLPDFAIVFLRKIKRRIIKYPEFHYVELHLTDHCNLNCKGCGHFCPIAYEWYADKEDYEKELIQLKKLFSNIKIIRLMGGEPLLHQEIGLFISLTRGYFPQTDLRLVTNGILLNKMHSEFWDVCVENDIQFDLTVYPPFINQSSEWISLISGHNLRVLHYVADSFFTSLN